MARRRFAGGRSRPTNWISLTGDPDNVLSVASGGQAIVATATIQSSAIGPSTIVRVRGAIGIFGTALLSQIVGVGIGLVSDRAATTGITAVPHPLTDEEWDGWLWRDAVYIGASQNATINEWVIDSKAMRKWDDDMTLVVVAENLPINTAGVAALISINGRILVKGP